MRAEPWVLMGAAWNNLLSIAGSEELDNLARVAEVGCRACIQAKFGRRIMNWIIDRVVGLRALTSPNCKNGNQNDAGSCNSA